MGDEYSKGCNRLIRDNRASLLLSAEDLVQTLGWNVSTAASQKQPVQRNLFPDLSEEEQLVVGLLEKKQPVQRNLFPDLSEEEQLVVGLLEKQGNLQLNALVVETNIPVQKMSALLFELEMKGMVRVLAGGMYQLLA